MKPKIIRYSFIAIFILLIKPAFSLGIKYTVVRGNPAFEWKNHSNIPYKVYGLGKALKTAVSKNMNYLAVLDKAGIELYDLKSLKFIKKLMLQTPAEDIYFKGNRSIVYKKNSDKYIQWDFFNFSFKKTDNEHPNAAENTPKIKVTDFFIKISQNNKNYIIKRERKYFYRFLLNRGKYHAAANKNGIIYSFKKGAYRSIKDTLYNIHGEIAGVTKEGSFILAKNNTEYKLYHLKGTGWLVKIFKAKNILLSPLRTGLLYIVNKNSVSLSLFSGRILKTIRFKNIIKTAAISDDGITFIGDKLYVADFNLSIKKSIKGNFLAACLFNSALYTLKKSETTNTYSLIKNLNNNKTTVIKNLKSPKLSVNSGFMKIITEKGTYYIKAGTNTINYAKNADNAFLLGKNILFLKSKKLYIKNDGNYKYLHISSGSNVFSNATSLFFKKQNSVHSLKLDNAALSFLKNLSYNALYKKYKNYKGNAFAQHTEIDNMLFHFKYIKDAVLKAANHYLKKEKYKKSLHLYLLLLAKEKGNLQGLEGIGISLFKLGKYKAALSYLTMAAEKKSKNYMVFYSLGTSYLRLKNIFQAVKYLELSKRLNGKYKQTYQNLGLAYEQTRRFWLAEKAYLKGLSFDKSNAVLHYSMGVFYEKNRRYNLALKYYKQACKLKPDDFLYLYFAGVVCAKLGKGDQALMYLKKAISMKPDYAPAHFNIAYTYQEIKRNNLLAKYHYIIFLKLEPGFPGKAKILRFIRSN